MDLGKTFSVRSRFLVRRVNVYSEIQSTNTRPIPNPRRKNRGGPRPAPKLPKRRTLVGVSANLNVASLDGYRGRGERGGARHSRTEKEEHQRDQVRLGVLVFAVVDHLKPERAAGSISPVGGSRLC